MAIIADLPEDENERLSALKKYNILDTTPEEAFDKITLLASQLFGAPIVLVSLVDEERQWFKSKRGVEANETPRDMAFCAHAILKDDILVVPDAIADIRFHDNPLVVGPPHIRTYVGAPLIMQDGYRLGTLCVIYDRVTVLTELQLGQLKILASLVVDGLELRRAVLETDKARRDADTANAAKSDFLAVMSHEIRTPLNGVLGAAEVLSLSGLAPQQVEFATMIRDSGKLLLDILSDILDLSKIEAGRVELEMQEFAVSDLVESARALWTGTAREKGLRFSIDDEPGDDTLVRGDPMRLRQIINNFLGNAIKFTAKGDVELRVRIVALPEERVELRIEVRDTGIGLTARQRQKLFQPFSQADSSTTREYGGTGLGLAICKQLVDLFDGEIGVDSTAGQGSTFWFTVEADRVEKTKPVASPTGTEPARPSGSVTPPSLRILLAEDNQVNQKVVSWMVAPLQRQLDIVTTGFEAVAAVVRSPYDLVLMDIQMPEMDGLTAMREIRSIRGASGKTPIIAMTANSMAGDRETYLQAGMDGYISKPIDREQLFRAIAGAMNIPMSDLPALDGPSPLIADGECHPLSGEAAQEIEDFVDGLDDLLDGTGRKG